MKPRLLHTIILALSIAASAAVVCDSVAAAAPAPAAAAAKKKKSTKKKSTRKKTARKKTSARKKTARKKTTSKRSTAAAAPKAEQPLNDSLTLAVNDALLAWIPESLNPGGLRVNSVKPNPKTRAANVSLNENFTYLPVTSELIDSLSAHVTKALPDSLAGYRVWLSVNQKPLSYYITTVDKLPEKHRRNIPFVVEANPAVHPSKGMEGDIVALWPSHGRYYKTGSGGWVWQRPLLFGTAEDLFTMSYIYPYAVPMLENAGAYVLLPRERDINPHEVIVDNDTNEGGMLFSQTYYREHTGRHKWVAGDEDGFIYDLPDFRDTENPFENGTYRQTETVRHGKDVSLAAWYADIPADGEYAVYVSYHSLPNSARDALYTVNYSGGSKTFKVNQTMGGGTWVYLGTFPLEAGYDDQEPVVMLSNLTEGDGGTVVTADAVKIGGGMGNIARSPRRADVYVQPSDPIDAPADDDDETDESEDTDDETAVTDNVADTVADGDVADGDGVVSPADSVAAKNQATPAPSVAQSSKTLPKFATSGLPRYLEGARYWLHWAGAPESVYSPYHGADDYKDDYTSRGHWVNWLAGGSRVLPDSEGLGIPVDVVLALHSDAGKRADDSFVGTLGIYYTNNGDSYADGTPRANSRTLTDMVMRQITSDIRREWEPAWKRRSMWDKSYVEARVPEVPTTLIELMSHQNFADMQYGLDPAFRFTVGRAIYKALARFVAERKGREVVIQPLPVRDFAIARTSKGHYRLSWQPTPDPLEPTAMPTRYLVMERSDDELGWHLLGETRQTHFDLHVEDTDIHSFRIVAANDGGRSFESETLALREAPGHQQPMLIINGFDRVSGPGTVNQDGRAGFDYLADFGVPWIRDISYTGAQTEWRRSAGESHGRSEGNMAAQVVAGNTFDYPYVHGLSIAAAGMGFVSASAGAVADGSVRLTDYPVVDLILGKQRATLTGNGLSGWRFAAFPAGLRDALGTYASKGGDILVSGQYVAGELFGPRSSELDRRFGSEVLGIEAGGQAPRGYSTARTAGGVLDSRIDSQTIPFSSTLNQYNYIVESPDLIVAAPGSEGATVLTLGDTGQSVGVASRHGASRTVTLTVPFESMTDREARDILMRGLLDYLQK